MILSDEQEENSLEMVSVFEAVETVGEYTLLKCRLITGKTHQLRAQLEHIGHPIIGDIKYANTASKTKTRQMSVKRQMLHCYKVTIPTDFDTVKVYSAPSEDMLKVIKKLGFRFEKEDIQEI